MIDSNDDERGLAFLPVLILIAAIITIGGGYYVAVNSSADVIPVQPLLSDGVATSSELDARSSSEATSTDTTSADEEAPALAIPAVQRLKSSVASQSVYQPAAPTYVPAPSTVPATVNAQDCIALGNNLATNEEWLNSMPGRFDEYRRKTLATVDETKNDWNQLIAGEIAVTTENDAGRRSLQELQKTVTDEWTGLYDKIAALYKARRAEYTPTNGPIVLGYKDQFKSGNCDSTTYAAAQSLNESASKKVMAGLAQLESTNKEALDLWKVQSDTTGDDIELTFGIARRGERTMSGANESPTYTNQPAARAPMRCQTTATGGLFDKNRTYNTNCVPDTRSEQEKYDECMARWVGQAGLTSNPCGTQP